MATTIVALGHFQALDKQQKRSRAEPDGFVHDGLEWAQVPSLFQTEFENVPAPDFHGAIAVWGPWIMKEVVSGGHQLIMQTPSLVHAVTVLNIDIALKEATTIKLNILATHSSKCLLLPL